MDKNSTKELTNKAFSLHSTGDYENAEKRLNVQANNEFYINNCDIIIENNGNILEIEKSVREMAEN